MNNVSSLGTQKVEPGAYILKQAAATDDPQTLSKLFDAFPDSVFLHDSDGNLTYVNDEACAMLGYTRQELLGMKLHELDDPSCLSSITSGMKTLSEKGSATYESAHICKSGVVIPVEIHSSLLQSEDRKLILSLAHDISERNKIRQHIDELEERYRTLFDNAPVGILEWDFSEVKKYIDELRLQGVTDFKKYFEQNPEVLEKCIALIRELRRNRTANSMFGTSDSAVLDQPSITKLTILLLVMLIEGRTYLTEEQRVKTNDGSIKYYLKGCYVPPSCKDTWARILVVDPDVTKMREAENSLKRSEARAKMLARKVIASQEEERTRIARELHDVVAQSLVDVRRKALALVTDLDKVTFTKSQSDLINSIDSVSDWVHNLTVELRPSMLDELGLIKASQWYTEQNEHSTGIACRVISNLGMAQASVIGKEVAIVAYRIMQEAILNAIRHARADRITVAISVVKKTLRFSITDNGIGITRQQIDSQSSLGLLGMKERATTLGGSLQILNNREGGTSIVALLPLSA